MQLRDFYSNGGLAIVLVCHGTWASTGSARVATGAKGINYACIHKYSKCADSQGYQ